MPSCASTATGPAMTGAIADPTALPRTGSGVCHLICPVGDTDTAQARRGDGGIQVLTASGRTALASAVRTGEAELAGNATATALMVAARLGHAEIVRLLPQTASFFAVVGLPVNLRGLVIADVTTQMQAHEGVPVLLVEGRIVSAAKHTVEVPRLRFAARNEGGNEIYTWTALPGRSLLGPGETLPFRSRLASPPAEARDVLVRFFNRRDRGGGE